MNDYLLKHDVESTEYYMFAIDFVYLIPPFIIYKAFNTIPQMSKKTKQDIFLPSLSSNDLITQETYDF